MNLLYVAAGGATGAVIRFLMMNLIGHRMGNDFPYSTLIVNISGSLAMGLLIGWLARALPANASDIRLFLAVGVLGGYTTFSSFSLDAITLMEEGRIGSMAIYIVASVLLSLVGLLGGLYLIRTLP
ncbi:MAG TPA: fluoride efflux transporter CrcB [Rickettsiales bacterium]|nr:fluoride efflux transporter CrcB [Rickettsiales bacterium]